MSDKMLYNEVKAKQTFLTLINATVSHELRNPLFSLICQYEMMKKLFITFTSIINTIQDQ